MAADPSANVPTPTTAPRRPWGCFALLLMLVVCASIANAYLWFAGRDDRPLPHGVDAEAPTELSFNGSSTGLKETVFLPTLERPIPPGKSALWCATLSMAWQELEKKVVKRPLDIKGAEAICRELARTPDAKLDTAHYFVVAGAYKDVAERMRKELPKKFPGAPGADTFLPPSNDGILAFAYLEASLHYRFYFMYDEVPLLFKDSQDRGTPVHAFGIRERDNGEGEHSFREQVLALFREKGEYAIDLSRNSKPYQIILARMARKPSLRETLDELGAKIAASEPKHLGTGAVLLVPSMNWKAEHRFAELEQPPVETALQSIRFKMDRKGAFMVSDTVVALPNGHPDDPNPNHFLFDRPFLIVMKKRDAVQPFFAMWVDNAELLQRR